MRPIRAYLAALGAGLVFGIGLALSQMTDPRKVLAFLDVAGAWDPSLAFVMGGAVGVGLVVFPFILRQPHPVLEDRFHLPTNTRRFEPRMLLGATLFGVGWGISGYCPGPALAQLAAPNSETWLFLPALMVGSAIARVINRR